MDIEISGLEETLGMLENAPRNIAKGAFAKALAAASVPVVDALVATAPEVTGDLKEHVMTDIAVDSEGKGGVASIGFGKEGWKARLVEMGHRMVGHKPKNEDLGTVRPHPFMAPAAASSAEAAVEAFAESVGESLASDSIPNTRTAA